MRTPESGEEGTVSVWSLTLRRSWIAAIPASLLALVSGSWAGALLIGESIFVVAMAVVFWLTHIQLKERRRWGAAGRPGMPGTGGIAPSSGLPTSYTGGHYPVDHPGEGGELRRSGIHGPLDPASSSTGPPDEEYGDDYREIEQRRDSATDEER